MKRRRLALILGVVVLLALTALLRGGADGCDGDRGLPSPDVSEATHARPLPRPLQSPAEPEADLRPRPMLPLRPPRARSENVDPGTASLRGRVLSRGDAAGIAGATLTFGHRGASQTVRTDDEGMFVFEVTESGRYELALVSADGFSPFAPLWGHSPIVFEASLGTSISGVEVRLERERSIRVLVTTEDGDPVADAEVFQFGLPTDSLGPTDRAAQTDARGVATLGLVRGAIVQAVHPDYEACRAEIDVAAEIAGEVVIALSHRQELPVAMRRLEGRVVDEEGDGVEGALVEARFEAPAASPRARQHPTRRTLTDPTGRFEVLQVDAGTYSLWASAAGYGAEERHGVRSGAPVLLELREEVTLEGRVVDSAGAPVAGFGVMVLAVLGSVERQPRAARTFYSPDGHFAIGGLASGPYEVSAVAAGYAPSEPVSVRAEGGVSQTGDLVLETGGILEGVVSGARGPIQGARVELEGAASGDVPLSEDALTGADGRYEIPGVGPGLRSVLAVVEGHHARILGGIQVAPGERTRVDITLSRVGAGERPHLELVGIGAVLGGEGDTLRVGEVLEGGGAAEAGLRPGDAIDRVDGTSVGELGFGGAIGRIRGPEGTSVRLSGVREGTPFELVVPRRRVDA